MSAVKIFEDKTDTKTGKEGSSDQEFLVYHPTLLIGIGGTGAQVLLRVKKFLEEYFPEGHHLHRFLFIDTDENTYAPQKGLPAIDQNTETCIIGFRSVKNFLENPRLYPHIQMRFPPEQLPESLVVKLAKGQGAAQIRALGALAVALDYHNVYTAIEKAHKELIELGAKVKTLDKAGGFISSSGKVMPYVVCSLAGGTGAGAFMDIAMMAKAICGGTSAELTGIFALPKAFESEVVKQRKDSAVPNFHANAYASLKEIQFALDVNTQEREKKGTIVFEYGSKTKQNPSLPPSDTLFDYCLLIDEENEKGRLNSLESLYNLMARCIFQEIGTRFGVVDRSRNINFTTLLGIEPCPETGRRRTLGSAGAAALVYPADRIARYWTYRASASVIRDLILGKEPSNDRIREAVVQFLGANKLDETGASNQILDTILSKDGHTQSAADYGLDGKFGKEKDPKEFVDAVKAEWTLFRGSRLKEIEKSCEKNKRSVTVDKAQIDWEKHLSALVNNLALTLASDSGISSVLAHLKLLEESATAMKSELERESAKWKEEEPGYIRTFNERCDQLEKIGIFGRMTDRDKKLKQEVINIFNDYVEQALWSAARGPATEILTLLVAVTNQEMMRWSRLRTGIENVLDEISLKSTEIEAARREKDGHVTRNVIEIDVTDPGYEKEFYYAKKTAATELLSIIVNDQHNGDKRKFFEDILGYSSLSQLGNMISVPLYNHIAPSVYQTSVVDFITHGKSDEMKVKGGERLKELLDQADMLCKPFWKAKNVGGAKFDDVATISVKHTEVEQGGKPLPPKFVDEWRRGREFEAIPYEASHEIVLTRKVYGARAFYLEGVNVWKNSYMPRLKMMEAGKSKKGSETAFMMESHITFRDIPDIFPEDSIPLQYFALALAYGFIVRRGAWYHWALEKERNVTGDEFIRVLYPADESHGLTVHHIARESGIPWTEKFGSLSFENPKRKIDKIHQMAQGRDKAFEVFKGNPNFIELVRESADIFLEETGTNKVRTLLEQYCSKVLDPVCKEGNIFEKEKRAILDYIANVGK